MNALRTATESDFSNSRFTVGQLFPMDDHANVAGEPLSVLVEWRSPGHFAIRHDAPLPVRRALVTLNGSSESIVMSLGATRFCGRERYETVAWQPSWRLYDKTNRAAYLG